MPKSAIEKNREYKEFSKNHEVAYYSERTKLLEDDNTPLTRTQRNDIMYTNNRDVRKWYINKLANLKPSLNTNLPLKERAIEAYCKRAAIREEARNRMGDIVKRSELDTKKPNDTLNGFEGLVQYKMNKKNLTRKEAYLDIIETCDKTNKDVNKELGIGG